jgi:hypothetical protein
MRNDDPVNNYENGHADNRSYPPTVYGKNVLGNGNDGCHRHQGQEMSGQCGPLGPFQPPTEVY